MKVLGQAEVLQLLSMDECTDVMAEALKPLGRGKAVSPLRHVLQLPDTMPAYLGEINAVGLKVISVFPENQGTELDSDQGAVMLFETECGRLMVIIDATAISAVRTAATSGVATRLLAREDASNLTLFGSGVQAAAHLAAMLHAREMGRVRVWSRTPERAQAFARRESERHRKHADAGYAHQRGGVERALCARTRYGGDGQIAPPCRPAQINHQ